MRPVLKRLRFRLDSWHWMSMPENAFGAPSRSGKEILPLTGVRALAAWSVVSFHVLQLIAKVWPGSDRAFGCGWLGVDLFFTLSGFVIALNYWDRVGTLGEYGKFVWLRLARLYPVHFMTLLGALAIFGGGSAMHMPAKTVARWTTATFIQNLFLVHHWRPAAFSWNSPAWSVSCEFLAYLVFPLFVLGSNRHRGACRVLRIVWALPFACLALAAWSTDGLVRIGFEFPAGCFLFIVYKRMPWLARHAGLLVIMAITGVLPVWYLKMPSVWMVAAMPMFVLGLAFDRGWLARLLRTKVPVFWGTVSYSLYMTHSLTLTVLTRLMPLHSLRILPAWIVAIGAVAVATYYGIEKPGRGFMRRHQPRFSAALKASPELAVAATVHADLTSST